MILSGTSYAIHVKTCNEISLLSIEWMKPVARTETRAPYLLLTVSVFIYGLRALFLFMQPKKVPTYLGKIYNKV